VTRRICAASLLFVLLASGCTGFSQVCRGGSALGIALRGDTVVSDISRVFGDEGWLNVSSPEGYGVYRDWNTSIKLTAVVASTTFRAPDDSTINGTLVRFDENAVASVQYPLPTIASLVPDLLAKLRALGDLGLANGSIPYGDADHPQWNCIHGD
jgi:hypothetical protein